MAPRDVGRALSDLAEHDARAVERAGGLAHEAAARAMEGRRSRRSRRRLPRTNRRVAAAVLAAAAVIGVVVFTVDSGRHRAPASTTVHLASPPAPRLQPVRLRAVPSTRLNPAVVVSGWKITVIPAGERVQAGTPSASDPTIADFGLAGADRRPAACRTKPALAVLVLTGSNAVNTPAEGPLRVNGHPVTVEHSSSGTCPGETLILWSPAPKVAIQVATTEGGRRAALLVARGIRRS